VAPKISHLVAPEKIARLSENITVKAPMIPSLAPAGCTKYKTTTEIMRKREDKIAVKTCIMTSDLHVE
jgi:hypothetical protein